MFQSMTFKNLARVYRRNVRCAKILVGFGGVGMQWHCVTLPQ